VGAVSLFCRHGRVIVKDALATSGFTCRIPQDRLIQMVFGFRSIYDVSEDPGVSVQEVMRPLLDVLFPLKVSYIAGLDWF
ncbi:MAG: hypothetical protein J7M34_07165, partial [Anaerolineae bacterium]|nr:hypothetical protein [Anaerolineae bacterium]